MTLAARLDNCNRIPCTCDHSEGGEAAIVGSGGYTSMTTHFGGGALDTPVLVHSYELRPTGVEYEDDDHWIVSLRDASGMKTGMFDYVYDRANHRIRLATFGCRRYRLDAWCEVVYSARYGTQGKRLRA